MDIFALLIGLVLVTASGIMVGLPLVRPVSNASYFQLNNENNNKEDNLEKRKEGIFTTLNEIEFDYRTQKLSEEDYNFLQDEYKGQAIAVLKQEEAMQGQTKPVDHQSLKAQIEAELDQEVAKILESRKS